MEICDKCGKPIGLREKSVIDDGIYHSSCAYSILGIEHVEED